MLPPVPPAWRAALRSETEKPYFQALDAFLDGETAAGRTVLPAREDIFKALHLTPLESVKVLLVGQDPYPTPGYAHGLCFSVERGVHPLPMSLRNVFKELQDDLGVPAPNNGSLEPWARAGVLLLNTLLTVRAREPNAHRGRGWETFTDRIIELVAAKPTRVVFLLWGASAQKKGALLAHRPQHAIISCAHPSPLSVRRFFGCRCFSRANQKLVEGGVAPIDWRIPDL